MRAIDDKGQGLMMTTSKPHFSLSCAVQQIAFADKILLNKVDLVSEEEKNAVVGRIRVGD